MATTYRVPTTGSSLFITDPGEIIMYQIRHYLATARSASNVYADQIKSYRDTVSRSGHDREKFRSDVETDMTEILKRIFYNDVTGLSVDISTTDVLGDPTGYNVVFTISITIGGTIHAVSPSVRMVNGVPQISNDLVTAIPLTATSQS